MSGQYTVYHLHSDLSNGVTNIDSVTKYGEYIAKAKECGMNAMGFSEHGSVFEWWHKKSAIEAAGMKYIHAVECYLTTTLTEKIRDNYHCVLLAKNYSGFLELNRLVSNSFCRKDNHFYYTPRITFDELFHTSDNILVTTACVGGVLGKGDEQVQRVYLDFLTRNRHRCFLEVGHHMDEKQISYNKKLLALSQELTIPLIAGTDTHVLNEEHEKGRSILQASKNIFFDGEERWDLKFKLMMNWSQPIEHKVRYRKPSICRPLKTQTCWQIWWNLLSWIEEPSILTFTQSRKRLSEKKSSLLWRRIPMR